VTCVQADNIDAFFTDPRFQGSLSSESRQRRQLYREAIAREIVQEDFASDYLGFLATCATVLEVSRYSSEDAERVAELVQRTNQLNFSGRKYTREGLEQILDDNKLDKLVLRSWDKYGSYGTVGFSIVENAGGWIQVHDLMLSCRVQKKCIEQAFFHYLFEHNNPEGISRLRVNFKPTERNMPARQVLESLGFQNGNGTKTPWPFCEGMIHLSAGDLRTAVVEVRGPALSEQQATRHSLSNLDLKIEFNPAAGGAAK
jgi:FkbH-like protein